MKRSSLLFKALNWFLRFKKYCSLLCFFLLSISEAYSQAVAEYGFKAYQGNFTPLVGGMSNNFQGTLDEGAWQNLPIGFNFSYEGIVYTTASASTNGFTRLGADVDLNAGHVNYINSLSSDTYVAGPVLAPLWDDLSTGSFSYLTTGNVGSRVFTMEWLNVKWDHTAVTPFISFQLKLYEGSNKIEFVYRQEQLGGISQSASIGIAGAGTGANSFLSLSGNEPLASPSAASEFTNIYSHPVSGQVFSFDYNLPPKIELLTLDNSYVAMSWGYGTTTVNCVLEESVGNNQNFQPVSQTNQGYFQKSNLTYETKYYYRVKRLNSPNYSEEMLVMPIRFTKYALKSYAGDFQPLAGANQAMPYSTNTIRKYCQIPIGFEFPYAGTSFNDVQADIGGVIYFTGKSNYLNFNGYVHPFMNIPIPMLAPLGGNMNNPDPAYKVSYQTSGAAPNRVFTVEWLNLYWNNQAASPAMSVQVKLYETSGKIEYVYRREIGTVIQNAYAIIGVKGYGNAYLSLLSSTPNPVVTSQSDNQSIRTKPLSGQVYSFEYNAAPKAPRIVALDNSTATLQWNTGANNLNYTLEQKIGANGSYASIYSGVNTAFVASLGAGANYFRLKIENSPYSEEVIVNPYNFSQLYSFNASVSTFTQLVGSIPGVPTGNYYGIGHYNNLPIPFSFPYGGSIFNTVSATPNGVAIFARDNYEGNALVPGSPLTSNISDFMLAPLGDYLSGGTFSYQTLGVYPSRVFVMEWLNMNWSNNAFNPVISFQIRLHETSGQIEYVYRQEAGNVVTGNASIGLRAPGSPLSGKIISLTGTGPNPGINTVSEVTGLNIKPLTGQIYSFTLPNTPPVANNQTVTLYADSPPSSITLTGSDADGNPLLYFITQAPQHGTLQGAPPNVYYRPTDPSYSGIDNFKFKVNDVSIDSPEATVTVNILPSFFCASKGQSSSSDWIDLVQLNTLINASGNDGGYRCYGEIAATEVRQTYTYTLSFSAGYRLFNKFRTEYWSAWIDFNQDNDFDDVGEQIMTYSSFDNGTNNVGFTIPASATLGYVRMRVGMKYGGTLTGPCEIFPYGEVEDYIVNIADPNGVANARYMTPLPSVTEQKSEPSEIVLYPNPVGDILHISGVDNKSQSQVIITDMIGREMYSGSIVKDVDVHAWPIGIYALTIKGIGGATKFKFVKK